MINLENRDSSSVFVAIVGRPNVGKSSLLNRLVGEKAAIVTDKPQTTRTRITGILTRGLVQYVFIDTPGIHHPRTRLGRRMAKTAMDSAAEGDVALMLFEPVGPLGATELELAASLKGQGAIALINKSDTVRLGDVLLQKRAELDALGVFSQVRAVSAKSGEGCEELLQELAARAAPGPHYFAADSYTDQPEKQLVAELIREQLLLNLNEEIPHGVMVEVERFKERPGGRLIDVDAVIYCEKKSHKGIIIGKGGAMLKKVAAEARAECEGLLGTKLNLQCWVKLRSGWRNDERALGAFGFNQ